MLLNEKNVAVTDYIKLENCKLDRFNWRIFQETENL